MFLIDFASDMPVIQLQKELHMAGGILVKYDGKYENTNSSKVLILIKFEYENTSINLSTELPRLLELLTVSVYEKERLIIKIVMFFFSGIYI